VVGAAVSQGKTITFGFDTSWTKFQDLRNDRSKRDFVTFGAAAGVAAAFSAPIGGVLFTLEEGASYWSTTLTFRAFFCAMITQLILNLLYSGFELGRDHSDGLFAFGLFNDFSGYATFELFIFLLIGAAGGVIGAFFNEVNRRAALYRQEKVNRVWKRALELLAMTVLMTLLTFLLPLVWNTCTPIPTDTADWNDQEVDLLDKLVQYQCTDNHYNQVASLYFVPADIALQQLFHFKESGGTTYTTFDTGALLMFFLPYFGMATLSSGLLCPAGLFVPLLLSGASFGRIVGHILNTAFPGYVTDSGTYALVGAAALLGGMSRMTMAGTIIMLEASGNSEFLLPLMLTFAAARYSGNAINDPIYDMLINLKNLPFLESSLKTLGLLNYHPIVEVMTHPVVTLDEVNKVGDVHRILSTMSHNGFPVVGKHGQLRGLILRKHLCTLIKLKAFSAPVLVPSVAPPSANKNNNTSSTMGQPDGSGSGGGEGASTPATIQLAPAATVFHDTLERNYPSYPRIEDIHLSPAEMNCYLDIRPYMDTSPYAINASSSIQRCYRFFRTMGLRHLVVLDGDHQVAGIITRKDITEHRLEHHWFHEGDNMQKYISVDPVDHNHILGNRHHHNRDRDEESGIDVGGGGGGGGGYNHSHNPLLQFGGSDGAVAAGALDNGGGGKTINFGLTTSTRTGFFSSPSAATSSSSKDNNNTNSNRYSPVPVHEEEDGGGSGVIDGDYAFHDSLNNHHNHHNNMNMSSISSNSNNNGSMGGDGGGAVQYNPDNPLANTPVTAPAPVSVPVSSPSSTMQQQQQQTPWGPMSSSSNNSSTGTGTGSAAVAAASKARKALKEPKSMRSSV